MEMFEDNSLMPFGKHKGLKLQDVPADHFVWLWENDRAGRLADYIYERLAAFRALLTKAQPIKIGYKRRNIAKPNKDGFNPYKNYSY